MLEEPRTRPEALQPCGEPARVSGDGSQAGWNKAEASQAPRMQNLRRHSVLGPVQVQGWHLSVFP